ncbi:MAG: NADH-quinone oxidoreductase subunit NuoG [Gammaproteobacteria bacterium WSBS_2016_MAG_OTU1]
MDIELEINGKKVRTRSGATIMEAASELGVYIPHFCYHSKLSIAANCRMCLVDVEKSPKPMPACATAAQEGMVVHTESNKAKEAQNSVMEFLLINHPLDCPICDQGGECQLQDLAVGYGMSKSRYTEEKRVVFEKNLGPLISTDMTRCIHCTRCVRFGREIGGIMELGMTGRGEHAEIMPFIEQTVNSELSGNMIDVCPVGALTSKPFRFTARPWELTKKPGLSMHDAWGSNLTLQIKGSLIKRVVPRENDDINECWISDRDRFSYLGLTAEDRVLSPLLRLEDGWQFGEVSWMEALSAVATRLKKAIGEHGANQVAFLTSPTTTMEELFLWQKLAQGLGCNNIDNRLRQRDFSTTLPTRFGFEIANVRSIGAVLFIGADPAREQPLLATRLRKSRIKRMSIGALDISAQMALNAQQLSCPSNILGWLQALNKLLGVPGDTSSSLFDTLKQSDALKSMAQWLQKAKGEKHIIVGDTICNAADNSKIMQEIEILGNHIGAHVGVLSPVSCNINRAMTQSQNTSSNGSADALPNDLQKGMSVAEILRAKPKAVMLLNCEPKDFAETALAESMLTEAEFVVALSPYLDGIKEYAELVLPTAIFGENEGTMINGEGRAQTFTAAVAPPGQSRSGWKVLRVLGEVLEVPGFDFSSLDDIRKMIENEGFLAPAIESTTTKSADTESNKTEAAKAKSTKTEGDKTESSQKQTMFEIIGGSAIYESDMLVRRAGALQMTAHGKNVAFAFLHPDDMAACNIDEGAAVRLGDEDGNIWDTQAFADVRLARGAILAYPPNLNHSGIVVEALPMQKVAS